MRLEREVSPGETVFQDKVMTLVFFLRALDH